MTRPTSPPEQHSTRDNERPAADQDKPHTADRYRNDHARWKEQDMPDTDPARNHAEPEDYERMSPDRPQR